MAIAALLAVLAACGNGPPLDVSMPAGSPATSPVRCAEVPGTEVPGTEVPGTGVPGTDVPGTDVPGTDVTSSAPPVATRPCPEVPIQPDPGTQVTGTAVPGTDVAGPTTTAATGPIDAPALDPAARSAEFALGSPTNAFGNDLAGFPDCVDPVAGCAGAQPNVWAAIQGPYESPQNGDPFSTLCASDTTSVEVCGTSGAPQNRLYNPAGQLYAVDVPVTALGQEVTVAVYDAVQSGTGPSGNQRGCRDGGTGATGAPRNGGDVTSDRVPTDSGSPCGGRPANISFELFDASADARRVETSSERSLARVGSSGPGQNRCIQGEGYRVVSAEQSRDESPGGAVEQMKNRWSTLCTFTPTRPGVHGLRVKTSAIPGYVDAGGGWNAFSLRATGPAGLRVYPVAMVSTWMNANGQSRLYVGEIPSRHAGRNLVIDMFDAGDGSGPSAFTMKVLGPPGCNGACPSSIPGNGGTAYPCRFNATGSASAAPPTPQTSAACTITTKTGAQSSGGIYNGTWLRVVVPLPADYACDADCWWSLRFDFGNGTINDRIVFGLQVVDRAR